MKLLIKTTTEDVHVNAAIDILLPTIKTIKDLGEPTVPYPTKIIWYREYEGTLKTGEVVKILLRIRKIKGGISISGAQEIKKPEVEK